MDMAHWFYNAKNVKTVWGGVFWDSMTVDRLGNDKCLEKYGYKVYSQNDEDGIIQEIFRRIGVTNKMFVEFGVQDGLESNGHYLLFQGWKGLWIEGSERDVKEIRSKFYPVLQTGQLKCIQGFITKDNINALISSVGVEGEIDLLSIDIDGNDYYVWEAIQIVNPRVVVIEYNGKFPPDCDWKMAYNETHTWDGSDWHGASLKALEKLGRQIGYRLTGTNLVGSNAFFVRNDLAGTNFFEPAVAEELYNPPRFYMQHISGHPARYCLRGQRENEGILNYMPDVTAIGGYGFHKEENSRKGSFRWSSEKNSQILIRSAKEWSVVKIPYFLAGEVLDLEDAYNIKIKVNDKAVEDVEITQPEGEMKIKLPFSSDEFLRVEMEVPFLWRPSDVFQSGDERELGIAIIFGGIKGE